MPPSRRPALVVAATTGLSALLIVAALTIYVRGGDSRDSSGAFRTVAPPRTPSGSPTAAATARFAPTISGLKLADDPEAPARAAFPVTDRLYACFAAQGGTDPGTLALIATAEGITAPSPDGAGIVARSLPVAQSADHACYQLDVERPPLTPGPYQVLIVLGNAVLARAPFNALPPSGSPTPTVAASRAPASPTSVPPAATPTAAPPRPATAVATVAPPPPTAPPAPPPSPTPTTVATAPPPPPTAVPTASSAPPTIAPTPIRTVPPPALDTPTPRPPPIPPVPTSRPPGTPAG